MKTVQVLRDFDYRPHPRMIVRFCAGITYRRVIEAAALALERAGAGRIVLADSDAAGSIDAWPAWQRRKHAVR